MADRFKLRRGPKNKIDLNVYELGYATDSDEERLYFNNGSMVPIPNNKDITDIKTELTETTNVTNKNKQDVSELKESVAGIIKTGVAKLVQYSYDIELSENTKKVNIPYERYSSVTDTLKVYVNGLAIQNDQYTITDPVENDGIVTNGYIVLKVERPAGTIVRIEVWKNVPSGEEGEVNGNIIAQNSLPLDRIIGINDMMQKIELKSENITPLNGWNDISTLSPVLVAKNSNNVCILADLQNGVVDINTQILQLPDWAKPFATRNFMVLHCDSTWKYTLGVVTVTTDGKVILSSSVGNTRLMLSISYMV